MAEETEDYISFQAEYLPTGSVSFGRFEVESLSWERRSSFSHNRYLEEVEKCSTPGSVTQKRAILEAHFKKKALLHQASLEDQNKAECQTTENDIAHHASYFKEFVDHDNGGQPEFAWYDETTAVSGEHEVMECEKEEETSPSEFPIELTPCRDERVVDPTAELSDHDETLQLHSEHDTMPSNKDNLFIVVEEEPHNKAVIMEELLEKRDILSKSPTVEKKNAPGMKTQEASLRVKKAGEQKSAKTKLRTQMPVQQILRKSSTERNSVSSVKVTKSMGKVERENTRRTESVRQLPLRTPTPTSSDSKYLKLEASENLKAKVRQDNRSEKDVKAKDGGTMHHSVSGRSEMDIRQPANRPKRVVNLSKEEVKQSGAVFNFKSDERAEKRKEYYMKLGEKLHAKEVEMNEIQARTQEETEAEIKQFRRSLNFKATPMPSFYHEAVPRVSEGKKKVAMAAKSQKLQSKCTSPGSRTSPREKSPAFSKASNRESSSSEEPNQASESSKKSEAVKKEERSKLNVGGNGRGKK